MWRTLRHVRPKSKNLQNVKLSGASNSTSTSKSDGNSGKAVFTLLAISGVGVGSVVAYSHYNPKFRKLIEDSVPYSDIVFRSILDWKESKEILSDDQKSLQSKPKNTDVNTNLLKKKQEILQKEDKIMVVTREAKPQDKIKQNEDKKSEFTNVSKTEHKEGESLKADIIEKPTLIHDETIVIENALKSLEEKLTKSTTEAASAKETAIEAFNFHTQKLYHALDTQGEVESAKAWKQADAASAEVVAAVKLADQKAAIALDLLKKLKFEIQKSKENKLLSNSSVLLASENSAIKSEKILKDTESKISVAQVQSKSAIEYKDLVTNAREQFKKELQVVLPKYAYRNKDQPLSEDDLNLLIAHAHRRIEQLQKELARQKITAKQKMEDTILSQKSEDNQSAENQIAAEVFRHQKQMELEFQKQVNEICEEYEADLRQQLRRQAAAHADHLQEALHIQNQELERQYAVRVEDELLQQKGVFISKISGSLARLKIIEEYLRARSQLDEAAQKTQALWVACQAMKNTLTKGFSHYPRPLGKELSIVKKAAGEESLFVVTVLSGIPFKAIERGIYTDEYLKYKFDKVKKVCRHVAMVGENRSLYRYALSYLQSIFIVDKPSIPIAELENKVAVNPDEWDTFDILNRISFSLQRNDLVQALRYANQLKGEPHNVAKTWISELRLLLETTQAIDCLIAHASAVGVQAYH